jgi:quercetin dioxygenase-like cupin family protein
MINKPLNAVAARQSGTLKAYKRAPELTNSTWYKGMLVSEMAGKADNNGAFDLNIFKVRPGTEPPPHVHSREDEFFYILSGEMRFYVNGDVFTVAAGEVMFLPRQKPHAFVVTTQETHGILLFAPGGFHDALKKMNAPAERMEVPTARSRRSVP